MMIILGADYATWRSREQLRCLRRAGICFVVRYLAPEGSAWKRLSPREVQDITSEGLAIVSVYQFAGNRPDQFTVDRAREDARIALSWAVQVGQPEGTPIYFAVDFDAQDEHLPLLRTYFETVRDTLEYRYLPGVYGSYRVVSALKETCLRFWQTYAWSGGRVSPHAHMVQFHNGEQLCGGAVDLNLAFGDPGFWPSPPPSPAYPEMPVLRRGSRGWQVAALQALLSRLQIDTGPIDGIFGPRTEAAVRSFQQARGLEVDGIAGPKTWSALLGQPDPPAPAPDWKSLYLQERARRERAENELRRITQGLRALLGI